MNEREKDDVKILISLHGGDNCQDNKDNYNHDKDNCHDDKGNYDINRKKSPHNKEGSILCADCLQLLDYALKCLDKCPYKEKKPACSTCPIHCYNKKYREQIRMIMRYSGPRMIYHKPSVALRHFIKKIKGS